jgi:hypothetical protein
MVSSEVTKRGGLAQLLKRLQHTTIDVNSYTGRVAEVAFDLTTFDSFIAGLATRLVSGGAPTYEEQGLLKRELPLTGTVWTLDSGEKVDLVMFPELLAHARLVESLRVAGLKRVSN